MISEAELESAMNGLAGSDGRYAELKADLENTSILRKRVRARLFLLANGTVAEREARAETNDETIAADNDYVDAIESYEALRAKRQRWELTIDVWRSLEASRRKAA